MKRLVLHFDVVSPFAYSPSSACRRFCRAAATRSSTALLFAGLLQHWGRRVRPRSNPSARGPSATCTGWRSRTASPSTRRRCTLQPLALLRLALACGPTDASSKPSSATLDRRARCERCTAPGELATALAPRRDPAGEEVKAELRRLTEEAAQAGVFGVPTLTMEGRNFWGLDALPMLRDALLGGAWFDGPPGTAKGRRGRACGADDRGKAERGGFGNILSADACQPVLGRRQNRVSAWLKDRRSPQEQETTWNPTLRCASRSIPNTAN